MNEPIPSKEERCKYFIYKGLVGHKIKNRCRKNGLPCVNNGKKQGCSVFESERFHPSRLEKEKPNDKMM
ncbi:MAG: hypothetical protein KBS62_00225 [Oscillospiraceae bacterium]|nr:hypothetical protein [Candidatus Ruminococcus equi]